MELPSCCQITNAAGKFLIVAPNTHDVLARIAAVKAEIGKWFLETALGTSNMSVVSSPCSCNDLVSGRFSDKMKEVFAELERAKLRQFDLCDPQAPVVLKEDYSLGVCSWNQRMPADGVKLNGENSCKISRDQIKIGELLTKSARLLVFEDDESVPTGRGALEQPIFGMRLFFTERSQEAFPD